MESKGAENRFRWLQEVWKKGVLTHEDWKGMWRRQLKEDCLHLCASGDIAQEAQKLFGEIEQRFNKAEG